MTDSDRAALDETPALDQTEVLDEPAALDQAAERIAARGPAMLLEQLRAAYAEAAQRHADIVTLEPERIEELVQRAAERADGLHWRRALAEVGSQELGISLAEAHGHPAVARAQQLAGAPSYEDALAELARQPVPPADPESAAATTAALAPEAGRDGGSEDARPVAAEDAQDAAEVEDEHAGELRPADAEPGPDGAEEEPVFGTDGAGRADMPAGEEDEQGRLRVAAVHLGGVANLPPSEQGIDLLISGDGLDIIRGADEILGRLGWNEIDTLEVPLARGRRRRRGGPARLVVRTRHGDATFEVPDHSSEDLRGRLEPLVTRFSRRR